MQKSGGVEYIELSGSCALLDGVAHLSSTEWVSAAASATTIISRKLENVVNRRG